MSDYSVLACVYDDFTRNVEYVKRADFLCTLFNAYNVKDNATVLDLACGTGTLTSLLSEKGYDMIGVDVSPDMLSEAQEKKFEKNLDVLYLCQDMTELNLFGTVGAAVSTLDSINHLKSFDDVKKVFRLVGLFSDPGAVFLFDINTLYKHRSVLGNNTFIYENEDTYCVWQNSHNPDDSIDIHMDIFQRDEDVYYRDEEDFREIAFEVEKCVSWLNEADFEILDMFDDYTDKPVSDTTQRVLIAARYIGKDYK